MARRRIYRFSQPRLQHDVKTMAWHSDSQLLADLSSPTEFTWIFSLFLFIILCTWTTRSFGPQNRSETGQNTTTAFGIIPKLVHFDCAIRIYILRVIRTARSRPTSWTQRNGYSDLIFLFFKMRNNYVHLIYDLSRFEISFCCFVFKVLIYLFSRDPLPLNREDKK